MVICFTGDTGLFYVMLDDIMTVSVKRIGIFIYDFQYMYLTGEIRVNLHFMFDNTATFSGGEAGASSSRFASISLAVQISSHAILDGIMTVPGEGPGVICSPVQAPSLAMQRSSYAGLDDTTAVFGERAQDIDAFACQHHSSRLSYLRHVGRHSTLVKEIDLLACSQLLTELPFLTTHLHEFISSTPPSPCPSSSSTRQNRETKSQSDKREYCIPFCFFDGGEGKCAVKRKLGYWLLTRIFRRSKGKLVDTSLGSRSIRSDSVYSNGKNDNTYSSPRA